MKKLVQTYAYIFMKEPETSVAPLRATGFRKRTRGIRTNAGVGYDGVFDDDFFTKRKEAMTMSKLNVLTERYMAQMKELEARMAQTRHKLEVVLEASQLLVEEGLSDEYPSDRSSEERKSKRLGELSSL
jgi:predicted TIM-barrel fold metal-dependent hydrolase